MKKINAKLFLSLSIFSFLQFKLAVCFCVVSYPEDIEISPIYAKILGKYTLYLPYNGKDLILNEGETIQGYCRTYFRSISYETVKRSSDYDDWYRSYNNENANTVLYNQSSLNLECKDNKLYFEDNKLEENILTCNKLNWTVYYANEGYDWCEKNQNAKTFLLAAKFNEDHHILAGICFNLNEWSLQTITYNVTSSGQNFNRQRNITKTNLKNFQILGDELSHLKTNYFDFTESVLQIQLKELTETNSWLNLANYELSPIVQGEFYKAYFNEFVHTLNIIWWRNLRVGNWKLFMNTLENVAYKNNFQIYTGMSGIVRIPSKNIADNSILEIKNGHLNKTVPGYIWTYITSTDNQNEDFIIVGYNSPFSEWFDINDIVFCPNICSEIPWLKKITPSFRYAMAGVMFCCSPDFVRQTDFLHGFPMDILLTRSSHGKKIGLKIEGASESMLNSTDLSSTLPSLIVDDNIQTRSEILLDI